MLENFRLLSFLDLCDILARNNTSSFFFSLNNVNAVAIASNTECYSGEEEGSLNFLPLKRSFNMFHNFCNKIFWRVGGISFAMPENVFQVQHSIFRFCCSFQFREIVCSLFLNIPRSPVSSSVGTPVILCLVSLSHYMFFSDLYTQPGA